MMKRCKILFYLVMLFLAAASAHAMANVLHESDSITINDNGVSVQVKVLIISDFLHTVTFTLDDQQSKTLREREEYTFRNGYTILVKDISVNKEAGKKDVVEFYMYRVTPWQEKRHLIEEKSVLTQRTFSGDKEGSSKDNEYIHLQKRMTTRSLDQTLKERPLQTNLLAERTGSVYGEATESRRANQPLDEVLRGKYPVDASAEPRIGSAYSKKIIIENATRKSLDETLVLRQIQRERLSSPQPSNENEVIAPIFEEEKKEDVKIENITPSEEEKLPQVITKKPPITRRIVNWFKNTF